MLTAAPAFSAIDSAGETRYQIDYRVALNPGDMRADVVMKLDQPRKLVRRFRFRINPERHTAFTGDGKIKIEAKRVYWYPPAKGGELRWQVAIPSKRRDGAFDAQITKKWAIFRGDDLVPAAATRTVKGAESVARLKFTGPDNWSFVTPYADLEDGWVNVAHSDRAFDRPTGWMAAGKLGVRREIISGIEVAVAGPTNAGLRRMDTLAFINWNLPALLKIVRTDCPLLVIVSAGDPMWRGGLSGPCSLYVHRDRPLISENGTSTLLHEIFHSLTAMRAVNDDDWIVEGLAEFYSIEIMRRTGTITANRSMLAFEDLNAWGKRVKYLPRKRSSGPVTARAVLLFGRLDAEIRRNTEGQNSLDDVVRELVANHPISLEGLRAATKAVTQSDMPALADRPLLRPNPAQPAN